MVQTAGKHGLHGAVLLWNVVTGHIRELSTSRQHCFVLLLPSRGPSALSSASVRPLEEQCEISLCSPPTLCPVGFWRRRRSHCAHAVGHQRRGGHAYDMVSNPGAHTYAPAPGMLLGGKAKEVRGAGRGGWASSANPAPTSTWRRRSSRRNSGMAAPVPAVPSRRAIGRRRRAPAQTTSGR
jgi:hypothetical protein